MITDMDRSEWAHHPVTVEYVKTLLESKQATMEAWANEEYVGDTSGRTVEINAKALGGVDMLNKAMRVIDSYKITEKG